MVHTLDLTSEYYYTRIPPKVNPFFQKNFHFSALSSLHVSPPPSQGRGGSVSRRDHNQAAGNRTHPSGGTNPKERRTPNASRSSGEGVWGRGASLREAASPPASPTISRKQVAAALSAAVTTTKPQGTAPTSQAEPSKRKGATQTPTALRERGVWGERGFSQRSRLSPQRLPSQSLRKGVRGRTLLYREAFSPANHPPRLFLTGTRMVSSA